MIETIKHLDTQLLLFLNGLHAPWLNKIMINISAIPTWFPLYILLIYLVIKNYKKNSIWVLAGVILLIVCSDQLSSHTIKPLVQRLRPCYTPNLEDILHLPGGKAGGLYSFTSSHAANTFALATYIFLALKKYYKHIGWYMFTWCTVVSYSRIYLGVHFPGDIICGAILGTLVALLIWKLENYAFKIGRTKYAQKTLADNN